MIELQSHPEGAILPVRAMPGSRDAGIRGVQDGALKVAVTQVAEKGKANKALAAVLCQALGVKKSQLLLLSGETSSRKRFLIRELSVEELSKRLESLLGA